MDLLERESGKSKSSLVFSDISVNKRKKEKSVFERDSSGEGNLPIVYVRRRNRKDSDSTNFLSVDDDAQVSPYGAVASLAPPAHGFQSSVECNVSLVCSDSRELPWSLNHAGILKLDSAFIESKVFEISIPLRPILTHVLGADMLWLLSGVLLLQCGTILTMWPTVCLEVLFVDNIVGLRLFIFRGCLKQAVAFVLLVMTVFCEPEKHVKPIDQKTPVTSVRFKLSFFDNSRKQKVFEYYCFSKTRDSNWLYLDSEFQPHCLLTKQLSLSDCTYDNIKLLDGETQHLQTSSGCRNTCLEVLPKKSNPGDVPMVRGSRSIYRLPSSRPSAVFGSKHGSLPPLALSFTAAPNFFVSLHLKLLLERGITPLSLQEDDSVHFLDQPCQPCADDRGHVEDHSEISLDSSPENHHTVFSTEAVGSGVVPTSPHLGKDVEEVSTDCSPRKLSEHVPDGQVNVGKTSIYSKHAKTIPVEIRNSEICGSRDQQSQQLHICKDQVFPAGCSSDLKGMSVEIPTSDGVDRDFRKAPYAQQATWNLTDGIVCSPNPTGPRSMWNRNRSSSNTSPFGDPLHSWADGKMDFRGNGFGNGPKKPRTQVHYTLPSGCPDLSSKSKGPNQNGLPYKRIRKANGRTSDASKGTQRNLELVSCDANLLINGGDKGWRDHGVQVFLEAADHNEWRLAVKHSGVTRYSYKVRHDLQPGSTNRFTYAMMWKGGKDWALEFPDRGQWFVFKEMHEECLNRNIRAASMKTIPIPGVRLIKESVDDHPEKMPFLRSSWYIRQVQTDVEMAMDTSHVLYDMDSDDEVWVARNRTSWKGQGREDDILSDELFEKTMDVLEKVSYSQQRDFFDMEDILELIGGVCPVEMTKAIHEHWREKRQRKGMPLIRHLQPPLWQRYQQMCKEWEQSKPKPVTTGSQEKASSGDKPPMFAFCLKPRGLELLNKGSKHRPHKKISLSGHSHAFLGDHDGPHSLGRRAHGYAFADEKAESSDVSPLPTKTYSPRDTTGPTHLSLNGDPSDWNHHPRIHRNNSKKIRATVSPKPLVSSSATRKPGKRNNPKRSNHPLTDWHPPHRHPGPLLLGGSDLDEFRLRDASSAAKHARNMAKLKRERAQKLMLSADLAVQKAVAALMTAEAIEACSPR